MWSRLGRWMRREIKEARLIDTSDRERDLHLIEEKTDAAQDMAQTAIAEYQRDSEQAADDLADTIRHIVARLDNRG